MGSIHSGRRNGKPLLEDCLSLDLAWLMRLGPIHEGQLGSGEVKWSAGEAVIGKLRFHLDLRDADSVRLILDYTLCQPESQPSPMRQAIRLTAVPQHFGGRRWWMHCPVTGERVRTLHLPPGGQAFASRKAWALAYRVERLSRFDRPFEKRSRVQRRLGSAQGLGVGLERPKGMWHRTYQRHLDRFAAFDGACAQEIVKLIGMSGVEM